jgi:hypothetical protein
MPSLADEARFWSTKAADAHHSMLETVQASAGKWQAALAAFLGVYATVGFVLGPDKLAALPVHGAAEIGLLVAYALAGILGLIAIILANLAAQGIPEILTRTVVTGETYYELVRSRAKTASVQLRCAIILAAAAGILVIAGSAYLLIAGVVAANHPHATVVSPSSAYCGELLNSNGNLSLRLPTGKIVPLAGGFLTQVSSCPG